MNIESFNKFSEARKVFWNNSWAKYIRKPFLGGYYQNYLKRIFTFYVGNSKPKILELGCGHGDLLVTLGGEGSVGVEFSDTALASARDKYSEQGFIFIESDVLKLELDETFDIIILSDLINDVYDIQTLFKKMRFWCKPGTRIIINSYSRLWQPALSLARRFGLVRKCLKQNWMTVDDIRNLLFLENYDVISTSAEIIFPVNIPVLSEILNRFVAKLFPFRFFALTNFVVARPFFQLNQEQSVSVVVAARNEEGNIKNIFDWIPNLGSSTELIFVEGGSSDDTYGAIEREIAVRPECNAKLFKQSGKGKGNAVRKGFLEASGDILMILDADLTVPPEDLPKFYKAIASGRGEFINGVRLVYPMEHEAMRFMNFLGNKFFSYAFSWLLGQPIKDTLCGTTVMWRKDYTNLAFNRSYFGELDPFGDFDLIFGAAKMNLKIIDLPIRYQERIYGDTNISRWSHGWLLIRMVFFALRKIKFL